MDLESLEFRKPSNKDIKERIDNRLKSFLVRKGSEYDMVRLLAPMVDVNLRTLPRGVVPSGRISKSGKEVYLELDIKKGLSNDISIRELPNYMAFIPSESLYVLSVPEAHKESVSKILNGDYTSLTGKEIKHIAKYSGLGYKLKTTTFENTALLLLALDTKSVLREILAQYLDVSVKDIPRELLPKLDDDSLVYIENYLKE